MLVGRSLEPQLGPISTAKVNCAEWTLRQLLAGALIHEFAELETYSRAIYTKNARLKDSFREREILSEIY